MAVVGTHALKPFTLPVAPQPVATQARNNDNLMRAAFNLHDADDTIHNQSGTLANRPVTAGDGAVYYCTDTQDTYLYTGGNWVQVGWAHWYGAFSDSTDQTAGTANVEQLVNINTADIVRGFTLGSSSKIIPAYDGTYNLQWSFQLANDDSQDVDVWIWPKVNGTRVPNSGGRVTVVSKHGSIKGHLIAIWNVYLDLDAGDEVQLYWETTNTLCIIEQIAAGTYHPAAPSVIVTINRV
jgi:hypothetical protein